MSLWEQLCTPTFQTMSIWELLMLVCFAASWPAAIIKTWRAKNPAGKSILFAVLIIIGYIAGALQKVLNKPDAVFWLYVFNGLLVSTDLILVLWYRFRNRMAEKKQQADA